MSTDTSFGNIADLHENMNGDQGNLVYLIDRDENEVKRQYESIKSAKSLIAAYSVGLKHVMVVMVSGRVKKIIRQKNKDKKWEH